MTKTPISAKMIDRRDAITRDLSPELRQVFEASITDPAQLSMSLGLGLFDADLARITQALKGTPGGADWEELRDITTNLGAALESEDEDLIERYYSRLLDRIEAGTKVDRVFEQIKANQLQRAKIAETETKRLSSARTALSAQEAELMIVILFRVMATHIRDPHTLKEIRNDFVLQMSPGTVEEPSDDITEDGDLVETTGEVEGVET